MNVTKGNRLSLGRCSLGCMTDEVLQVELSGQTVRLCGGCAAELAVKLIAQTTGATPPHLHCVDTLVHEGLI